MVENVPVICYHGHEIARSEKAVVPLRRGRSLQVHEDPSGKSLKVGLIL